MTGPRKPLQIEVLPQPSDSVCGPTCLHAVYRFFGLDIPLDKLIQEIPSLPHGGGSLAVHLGCHARRHDFTVRLYTNDLRVFDPTWFREGVNLKEKLLAQAVQKSDAKLKLASLAYVDFLDRGGTIHLESLTLDLLRNYLSRGLPILAGLSATYLYNCPRELPDSTFDDVRGEPAGHFVVIRGYDQDTEHVQVADPLANNPRFSDSYYSVSIGRLLASIHLGIVTYDANLLVLEPPNT